MFDTAQMFMQSVSVQKDEQQLKAGIVEYKIYCGI